MKIVFEAIIQRVSVSIEVISIIGALTKGGNTLTQVEVKCKKHLCSLMYV